MDYVKSLTRAGNCQFYGHKTHEDRRPDKAVATDEACGVREAIGTGYVASGTVRKRPFEGSYLRGRTEMENHA